MNRSANGLKTDQKTKLTDQQAKLTNQKTRSMDQQDK